jgi:hypothetical protein
MACSHNLYDVVSEVVQNMGPFADELTFGR